MTTWKKDADGNLVLGSMYYPKQLRTIDDWMDKLWGSVQVLGEPTWQVTPHPEDYGHEGPIVVSAEGAAIEIVATERGAASAEEMAEALAALLNDAEALVQWRMRQKRDEDSR